MIGRYMKVILLVTGIVTATMIEAFFAPGLVLAQLFVEPPTDAVSLAVTRHWGVLVFCFGVLLLYAAYRRDTRKPVLIVTILEKSYLWRGCSCCPWSCSRAPMWWRLRIPRSRYSIFCIWPASKV